MGELVIFDLNQFIENFGCKTYIETGTGMGVCLSHALKYPFTEFYSIELDGDLANDASVKFPKANIIHNYSSKGLKELLPKINDNPVLFFLDAHFPGADFHKMSYEESIREFKEEAFPLLNEIKIIKSLRDISKDVFIIDDWKLYDESYNYEFPGWDYKNLQQELNLITKSNDITNEFKDTHNYKVNIRHQGFLIVTPQKI
jgi:hypothetical protein